MRWLLLLALTGCSYPEFYFAPKTDSGGGAPDESVDETMVVADTAAAEDTLVDSSVEETDPPDTFASDTGAPDTFKPDVAPEAPPAAGCAGSTAKFCVDWDKSTTPASDFNYSGVSPGCGISLDSAGGRSAPNALLAQTTPSSTEEVVVANMSKLFTIPAPDALIRADVYLKLESATYPTTTGGAAFLFKVQNDAGSGDGVTFSINENGYLVDRIGLTYEAFELTTPKPKASVWTHVRLHARLHTSAGSLTVWIDDMTTPAFSRSGISTIRTDGTARQMIVGLYAQRSSAPFRVRYDDVTLNY